MRHWRPPGSSEPSLQTRRFRRSFGTCPAWPPCAGHAAADLGPGAFGLAPAEFAALQWHADTFAAGRS